MTSPPITRRWHWRDQQITLKSSLRQIARNWVIREAFRHKRSLEEILELSGGRGSYWYHVDYGCIGGPGKGKMEVKVSVDEKYQAKKEVFLIKEIYREVVAERKQLKLI